MCFRKIIDWFKPDPIVPIQGQRVALLFAIGNYPGTQNDLTGPPYDMRHVTDFIEDKYPEYVIKQWLNSAVTRSNFENALKTQFAASTAGDKIVIYYSGHGTNGPDAAEPDSYREGLYLYDGTYWDDLFTETLGLIPAGVDVTIILDSCFAHGSTTPKLLSYQKTRFVKTQKGAPKKLKPILRNAEMNYIVIAACGENQTSADIGAEGGAFTKYFLAAWNRDYTWAEWTQQTAQQIAPSYDQIPNIEGSLTLMNKQNFN